jgi:hypothetical protein
MKIPAWPLTLMSAESIVVDPRADACLRDLIAQISALRQAAAERQHSPAVFSIPSPEEFIVTDDL